MQWATQTNLSLVLLNTKSIAYIRKLFLLSAKLCNAVVVAKKEECASFNLYLFNTILDFFEKSENGLLLAA